ncbi:hypothetical protein N7470_001924 [Penicillium chermesinum]|nr:hypothetical protein N7470_001924 [Penicillium chermesinum]
MANTAQCYYCFESLYASFENREPASLTTIEALWAQHEQSKKLSTLQEYQEDPAEPDDEESGGIQSRDLRPQGVSRLQSETSIDSSSTAPTPSSTSNRSANSLLSTSTAATSPSTLSAGVKSSDQRYPLFVTWDTLSRSGHKSLRGCIGTFEPHDLAEGLKDYALTSAFDDTRFNPIPKSLLPSLMCSLTLLGSFEPCTDPMDWVLDVAVEQGWTKEEAVESLMRKAGWDGGSGSVARRLLRTGAAGANATAAKPWEQVSDFRTTKYQGLKASASYAEWQEWRDWVLSLDDGQKILESS